MNLLNTYSLKKLSNSEMEALGTLLDQVCSHWHGSTDPEEKLYRAIFEEMRISIEQRLIMRRKDYKFTMKPYQAIAFWIAFNGWTNNGSQLSNLLMVICNSIDREIINKP